MGLRALRRRILAGVTNIACRPDHPDRAHLNRKQMFGRNGIKNPAYLSPVRVAFTHCSERLNGRIRFSHFYCSSWGRREMANGSVTENSSSRSAEAASAQPPGAGVRSCTHGPAGDTTSRCFSPFWA